MEKIKIIIEKIINQFIKKLPKSLPVGAKPAKFRAAVSICQFL